MKKFKKITSKAHRARFIRAERGGIKALMEYIQSERMKKEYKENRKEVNERI